MNKKLQGIKKKVQKTLSRLKKALTKSATKNAKAISAVKTYVQNVVAFSVGIGLVEGLLAPLAVLPLSLVIALGYSLVLPSSKDGIVKFYFRASLVPVTVYATMVLGFLLLQGAPLQYSALMAISSSLGIIGPAIVAGMFLRLRGR